LSQLIYIAYDVYLPHLFSQFNLILGIKSVMIVHIFWSRIFNINLHYLFRTVDLNYISLLPTKKKVNDVKKKIG